ncbi:MAG: Hsp20/alpha crystallin family protein [Lewinellaceae bacterium]|nr:Hsp20/alpha crystallin family protein [Lewinellaceae bacterium]
MANIAKIRTYPSTNLFPGGLFNDFFNRSIADFVGSDALVSQPAINVVETNADFRLEVAAPGFDKQDFVLNVENDSLTISAKRAENQETSDERFTRREFRFESFQRTFKLPQTVNQDAVKAVYENGILKVTLPKREDSKAVSKTIAIG